MISTGSTPKNPDFVLVVSVKVRMMMWCADLSEHPNDDAEESTQLGHKPILPRVASH